MKGRIFAGLFLCSLFIVVGGDAQNRDAAEKRKIGEPVWTLEFIRVTRGEGAMAYLDDNWMRVRAEAKKEGAVLDYHRMQNAVIYTLGRKVGDPRSMVLMTEYKDFASFEQSEKLFASIRERFPKGTPGVLKPQGAKPEDFYEIVDSQVFIEEPEVNGGFKLLAKK
jgi:hypothetical protein